MSIIRDASFINLTVDYGRITYFNKQSDLEVEFVRIINVVVTTVISTSPDGQASGAGLIFIGNNFKGRSICCSSLKSNG